MTSAEQAALLQRYARGEMSAFELRRALGGASFGEVLGLMAALDLPLPRASSAGREERLALARTWLFPHGT